MLGAILPQALLLPLPLLLALVLSRLMPRHRVTKYLASKRAVPFASLWRRALAQTLDLVLVGAPMATMQIQLFARIHRFPDSSP